MHVVQHQQLLRLTAGDELAQRGALVFEAAREAELDARAVELLLEFQDAQRPMSTPGMSCSTIAKISGSIAAKASMIGAKSGTPAAGSTITSMAASANAMSFLSTPKRSSESICLRCR